jgi:hypothetical protein
MPGAKNGRVPLMENARRKFWALLDSESVRLFVWPYYIALLAFGVWALIHKWPYNVVETVMGPTVYHAWAFMHIPGTLFVMIGLAIRYHRYTISRMGKFLLFLDYLGLHLQRGGHACMAIILAMFETSMIVGYMHGIIIIQTYVIFLVSPYVLGCVFLTLQVHRKIVLGERLHRKIKGGHAR